MYTIYLLTIIESHKFDNVCHTSAHPSYDAAQAYADAKALPQARLRDELEWARYFRAEIEAVEYHGQHIARA